MSKAFENLYKTIEVRKQKPQSGSYTCYLFEKGLDKILKKIGEEAAETIIAAKNEKNQELKEEICDLIYHLFVMMQEKNIELKEIEEILEKRSEKIGNLKEFHKIDHNS